MSWAKYSDTAAFHPVTLRPLDFDEADDRTVNELFGFVARCTTQAAAHDTDYIVDLGTAKLIAGMSQYKQLTDQAVRAGYMSWVEIKDEDEQPRLALKLVEDENLFHLFLKSERAAENRRKKDGRDERLTVGARLRDGDQCRYCGNAVRWTQDRKSGRAGTYDHVKGLKDDHATKLEEYVIACTICNKSKGDRAWIPLPPPETPYYSRTTASFLKERGHEVPVARRVPSRPTTPEQFAASQRRTVEQPTVAVPDDQATVPTGLDGDLDAAVDADAASQRRTVEQPTVAAPDDQATVPTGLDGDLDATSRQTAQRKARNHGPKRPRQIPAGQAYPVSGSVGSGLGAGSVVPGSAGLGRVVPGSAGLGAASSSAPAGTSLPSAQPAPKRKRRRKPRNREKLAGKDQGS